MSTFDFRICPAVQMGIKYGYTYIITYNSGFVNTFQVLFENFFIILMSASS